MKWNFVDKSVTYPLTFRASFRGSSLLFLLYEQAIQTPKSNLRLVFAFSIQ